MLWRRSITQQFRLDAISRHPTTTREPIAPGRASVSLSPTFLIAKAQQQRFKLTKCLLLIGPDRLENDTGAAI